jgi:hypothetical protein
MPETSLPDPHFRRAQDLPTSPGLAIPILVVENITIGDVLDMESAVLLC